MGFSKTIAGKKGVDRHAEKMSQPLPVIRMKDALKKPFKEEIPDPPKFRSSSLPYCPIVYAREMLKLHVRGPEPKKLTYFDRFYTTIGTAMHLLWQEVLAAPNEYAKPFGSWKNLKTGEEILDTFRPKTGEWEYVEIEMEYRGLSCHVDFVEYYKDFGRFNDDIKGDGYVIWDLKSAQIEAIKTPEKSFPVIKNVFQIESYMCIFEHLFGIRPRFYGLFYQARDSHTQHHPHLIEWTDKKRAAAWKRLDAWADTHEMAKRHVKTMVAMLDQASWRDGAIPAQKTYSHARACQSMTELVEARPCQTPDQYERIMAPCFFYEGGCRHAKQCTKQTGQRLVMTLVEALRPDSSPPED